MAQTENQQPESARQFAPAREPQEQSEAAQQFVPAREDHDQPESSQQFISWFRQSSPYIHKHRTSTFVLLFGGEAVESENFAHLIHDIALLNSLGVRLVLVHGARPQIEKQVTLLGLESEYANDLRVTTQKLLPAVEQAVGQVRVNIEARLSMGLVNTPMADARLHVVSGNFVTAKPYGVRNGIDYCHTGEVRKVDTTAINTQLDLGNIALLSSIGYSPSGEAFNLSAEEIATETAIALNADKLIIMTPNVGIMDDNNQLIQQLDVNQANEIYQQGKIDSLTQKHLQSAINACLHHVERVHLISHAVDGALLLELYSRDGTGTLISKEKYEGLRQATIDDVGGIMELIQPLEQQGILTDRSREQLELEIENFSIIERDGMIVACAALFPYVKDKMAELACLAVHPEYQQQGRAETLLDHLKKSARQSAIEKLFLLTTHTAHWFIERGFIEQDIESLPMAKKQLYNLQRNSKVFVKTIE